MPSNPDYLAMLRALDAFNVDLGPFKNILDSQKGAPAAQSMSPIDPSVLGDLVRGGGFLDRPQAGWGHVTPYRGTPGQFMFGAHLPLAGALNALPQNALIDALRALSPQLDFRAVSDNPWSPPSEYQAGIMGGWRW